MSKYICNICDKEYSSKDSLHKHQKTAKFCLRLKKSSNIGHTDKCEHCDEEFKSNTYLVRHYEFCKIKKEKQKIENEIKKDELIFKLQNELRILMTETYPERENNLKEEINSYKTEVLVLKEQLKMKDEIINILQNKNSKQTNNTNTMNNTIINIQATKELLDKMMPINKLNENMMQDENFKNKLFVNNLSDVVADYIHKNNAVYITDYAREKGVVMVENKDNTITPKIGGIPQLLEEHKIGCEEPFEDLLNDIKDKYYDKVENIPNDEKESKLFEILSYQGKARQCIEELNDIKKIKNGEMSNVKLYSDTSKNIKKAAVKVDSYVVKKLMNNNPSEIGSLLGSGDSSIDEVQRLILSGEESEI